MTPEVLTKKMTGFKAVKVDKDGKYYCRDKYFTVGKLNTHKGGLKLCSEGFHFCPIGPDVYNYYSFSESVEVFEIEIPKGAKVIKGDDKWVTDKFKLIKTVPDKGFNTGDCNTGNSNTGNSNTGDCNTGNRNTGYWNTGNRNTGNRNSGDCNTGYWNTGYRNTGDCNTGDCNTGDWNTGNGNTGDWNTGYRNTGYRNTGDCNTGDCNTGDWNTGNWNTCNNSTGFFNTIEQPVSLFNGAIIMMRSEVEALPAFRALFHADFRLTKWVSWEDLTPEQQAKTSKNSEGMTIALTFHEACADWWARMPESSKALVQTLPGFDAAIFKEITGIEV